MLDTYGVARTSGGSLGSKWISDASSSTLVASSCQRGPDDIATPEFRKERHATPCLVGFDQPDKHSKSIGGPPRVLAQSGYCSVT